jgi:hypothetical protein
LDQHPKLLESNPANKILRYLSEQTVSKSRFFAKLRNGDTAFTIDLRDHYTNLHTDLKSNNESEPEIEIMVVMRKSTRDHSYGIPPQLNPQNRPDLLAQGTLVPGAGGNYQHLVQYRLEYILETWAMNNYFFRGIELFGRGRRGNDDGEKSNARRSLLAGTPGRDNTGLRSAYPRRRFDLTGKQRDQWDIIDINRLYQEWAFGDRGRAFASLHGEPFRNDQYTFHSAAVGRFGVGGEQPDLYDPRFGKTSDGQRSRFPESPGATRTVGSVGESIPAIIQYDYHVRNGNPAGND